MKIEPPTGTAPGPDGPLADWLDYIERQHPQAIAMGLDRVSIVRDRLGLVLAFPVIAVGGTNGKGSTCAMLESIAASAGYRTGLYTSPHLLAYNERVRIDRAPVSDRQLCEAFVAVERARGGIALTYFEFGTLGAAWLFARAGIDIAILEVGLGGRLDAVNAFDADCAIITSIGLDHMDMLGPTRESIGFEKAGIFRAGRPAVIAEPEPPASMRDHARAVGTRWIQVGVDYHIESGGIQWRYSGPGGARSGLPYPALRGQYQLSNAAAAITALDTLRDRLPVSVNALREGLLTTQLSGRFQVLPGRPMIILDVAHNPHASERLAGALGAMTEIGKTHAVFAMLRDKDIEGVVRAVKAQVDCWYLAPLPGVRGGGVQVLEAALDSADVLDRVECFASVAQALRAAQNSARLDDRIVVFGSFLTVAQALEFLERNAD